MSSGVGPAMLGVFLVDLGIALGAIGLLTLVVPLRWVLVPTRRRAAALLALGAAAGLAGVGLPAPEQQAGRVAGALDRFIPRWQFSEHHERIVHASPARVASAIHAVRAEEIRLFRVLTWIRRPHLPGSAPESILAPPAQKSLIDVALASGFFLLAEEPEREIVIGSLVVVPDSLRQLPPEERARLRAAFTPEDFRVLDKPGYAKAVMNFAITDLGDGLSLLTSETRVLTTDAGTTRRFAAYWRLIYPGSALIRRNWLAAIQRRAEESP